MSEHSCVQPPAVPEGFEYSRCSVSVATWDALRSWLDEDPQIPWERAIEGRRVAQWGARYDYATQSVDCERVAEIPAELRSFFPSVGERFTQCIINEYGPHDGIPWHSDDLGFGPQIIVFVFGESRHLRLRKGGVPEKCEVSVLIEHLGSYSLCGAARYEWEHSVPPGEESRLSVTFRSMAVPDEHE